MASNHVEPGPASVRVLTEVGRALTNAGTITQVARLATRGALDLLSVSGAVLGLEDPTGRLRLFGTDGKPLEAGSGWDSHHGLEAWLCERLAQVDARTLLAVPLVAKQAVIGFLAVAPVSLRGRERADWLLSALADHVAVSIDSLQTQDLHNQALRTLSHDVRTPLQTVKWCTTLLAAGDLGPITPPQRQVLTRLETSIRHLGALVTNMLDMAALESNRFEIARTGFDLGQATMDAVDIVRPEAASKGHFIETVIEPCVKVVGDPDRLRQVAINLLQNAVKYCPEGCRVGTDVHRVGTDGARLVVWDDGPGIAADELDRIFEPYYRSRTAPAAVPGIGLGLAICRRLTAMMGGRISVESRAGEGCRFAIDLPCSLR